METGRKFRNIVRNEHFSRAIIELAVFSVVSGYVFYRSVCGVIVIFIFGLMTLSNRIKAIDEQARQKKREAFVDFLNVARRLSASGLSIPACFSAAQHELKNLYPEETSWIRSSIAQISVKLSIDTYAGPYIQEWGERERISEIFDFGQVVSVLQKHGGDTSKLVGETASVISQRIDTERHIWVIASSKIFEQKVLLYLGYIMVLLLNTMMPDIFNVLYTTLSGRFVMTFSFVLMLCGKELGLKMSRIEV